MITKEFQRVKSLPLDGYKVEISPLNPKWHEYNNWVVDYEKENLAVTNRLIPPYNGTSNHGDKFYDDIIELVNFIKPQSIVDLGCGAGELLSKVDCPNKFGLTLHVGEVRYARERYKLENVIPADMRDIDKYFRPSSIDMVVAFWAFNYLIPEDRIETLKKINKVLKPGKYFVHMDEYQNPDTVLPETDETFISNYKITQWGKLTILVKNVQ